MSEDPNGQEKSSSYKTALSGLSTKFRQWWHVQATAVYTIILIALTLVLIAYSVRLDSNMTAVSDATNTLANMEKQMLTLQATDSPPQLELLAMVTNPNGTPVITYHNRGSSYVARSVAWCWTDDSAPGRAPMGRAIVLGAVVVGSQKVVTADQCARNAVNSAIRTGVEPTWLYTFVVFDTPSGLCKTSDELLFFSGKQKVYLEPEIADADFAPVNGRSPGIPNVRAMLLKDARDAVTKKLRLLSVDEEHITSCLSPDNKLG